MASTRSNPRTRRVARTASAETPGQALVALARHGARIQLAGGVAVAGLLAEWAQSADRLAQAVLGELLRGVDGDADSAELVRRLTAAGSDHLRELTALPRTAADQFDAQLARTPGSNVRSS